MSATSPATTRTTCRWSSGDRARPSSRFNRSVSAVTSSSSFESAQPRILPMAGRWLVRTESAAYRLDLDAHTVTRSRSTEPGQQWPAAHLRRDDEVLRLQSWGPIGLGESMTLLLVVRADGTSTVRTTTPVRGIERDPALPEDPPEHPSPVSYLAPGMTGTWCIQDDSSLHVLDLDDRTYRWSPAQGATDHSQTPLWRVDRILLWPCLGGPASFICSAIGRAELKVAIDTRAALSIQPWRPQPRPARPA